jgi:hypothetical protein
MPNSLLLAIGIKWAKIPSPIISAKALDLLLSFSLNRDLELLEYIDLWSSKHIAKPLWKSHQ